MGREKCKTKKNLILTAVILGILACLSVIIIVPIYYLTYQTTDPFESFDLSVVDIEKTNAIYSVVEKSNKYLAHPDLVYKDGKYITMYVLGHGKGQIITKISGNGVNWGDRVQDTPKTWEKSQETPTLYELKFVDENGEFTQKSALIMISGCPKWPGTTYKADGFQFSISEDGGANWTEFEKCYGRAWGDAYDCIVAMSSLTQIKENGRFVNKWMGTFHDRSFINYKTYLTFEESYDGKLIAHWTKPEKLFDNHREDELKYNICEVEIIRTPSEDGSALTGNTLILLARANKHETGSLILFSNDEGETWSKPRELPAELTGDRHKAEYDPISKKLIVSFRQVWHGMYKNAFGQGPKAVGAGWLGWVGTFEDLLSYRTESPTIGEKVLLLGKDYGGKIDCGYSGTACVDGRFTLVAYGQFDKDAKVPYIRSVSFALSDVL